VIGTLAVDGWAVVWYSDEEPILGMFTSTMEFFKQQQNVMPRGTGPHMTSSITRLKRKLDNNVRALSNLSSHEL